MPLKALHSVSIQFMTHFFLVGCKSLSCHSPCHRSSCFMSSTSDVSILLVHVDSQVLTPPVVGTGGTIAGISRQLKSRSSGVQIFLVDPPGSGLYNKVTRGVMFTSQEAEQKRLRNPFDTITEGVGINRITRNFSE